MLVGALNMGEYAYDFTGENVHDGPSRNPHDHLAHDRRLVERLGRRGRGRAGAALARFRHQRLDPRAVLACGLFGLKPTYGRLSRARTFPFVASLDHLGPLARTARPRARLRRDAGARPGRSGLHRSPGRAGCAARSRAARTGCASRSRAATSRRAVFPRHAWRSSASPRRSAPNDEIEIPEAARARAAAYVITAAEGAALHLDRLRTRANDYDPAVRDRLIAGAMMPAALVDRAQKFRRWYRAEVLKLFEHVDAILAPATPCSAPAIGQQTFVLDGVELPVRPISASTPNRSRSSACPWWRFRSRLRRCRSACRSSRRPWREDIALRIAHALEQAGVCGRTAAAARGDLDMEIDLPEVVAEVKAAVRPLREGPDVERRRDAQRALPRRAADDPLWHRAKTSTATTQIKAFRGARSPVGLMRTHLAHRDHHLWPRLRGGVDAVPPRDVRPARSAARCRPGCASPMAGAWSPRT